MNFVCQWIHRLKGTFQGQSCFKRLLAPLFLFFYTLLLAHPFWNGKVLYWGDILYYFEPMASFAISSLAHGKFPMWNPYLLCGQPYVGNPQIGLFYPYILFLPWVSPWRYLSMGVILHIYLGALFSYLFFHKQTGSMPAALLGAVCFVGGGAFLGKAQFPPMLFSVCYLPLLFYGIAQRLESKQASLASRVILPIAVSLLLLAAHPQVAYLSFLLVLVYLIFRGYSQNYTARSACNGKFGLLCSFRNKTWALIKCLPGMIVGVLLSSGQVLPAMQLALDSSREKLTPWQANRFVLHYVELLKLVFPHFLGSPATANYWGPGNAWETAVFLGWVPVFFVGYAAVRGIRYGEIRFWIGIVLFSVWLALGIGGGLYFLAFYVLPGLSIFHDPARFLILAHFGLCTLCSYGFAFYLKPGITETTLSAEYGEANCRSIPLRRPLLTWGLVILAAGTLVYYSEDWLPTTNPAYLNYQKNFSMALGRIYTPEHATYWNRYVTEGYADYGERTGRLMQMRVETLLPNVNMDMGLPSASAYEPVPIAAAARMDGLVRAAIGLGEPTAARLIRLMDVAYLLLPSCYRLYSPFCELVPTISPMIRTYDILPAGGRSKRFFAHAVFQPTTWAVTRLQVAKDTLRQESILANPHFNPWKEAVVRVKDVSFLPFLQNARMSKDAQQQKQNEAEIRSIWQSPNRIEIFVTTKRPVFLVTSVTAQPGWHAVEGGHNIPLYSADLAFLGMVIHSGVHHIHLEYSPSTLLIGLYLSFLMAAWLSFVVVTHSFTAKRSGHAA